jgi:hypothetical protein
LSRICVLGDYRLPQARGLASRQSRPAPKAFGLSRNFASFYKTLPPFRQGEKENEGKSKGKISLS